MMTLPSAPAFSTIWRMGSSSARLTDFDQSESLRHRSTKFYCSFEWDSAGNRVSQCSPGEVTSSGALARWPASSWAAQKKFALRWLKWVKRELDAGDPWAEIVNRASVLSEATTTGSALTR